MSKHYWAKGEQVRFKNLIGYLNGKKGEVVRVIMRGGEDVCEVKLLEDAHIWKEGEQLIVHPDQIEEVK